MKQIAELLEKVRQRKRKSTKAQTVSEKEKQQFEEEVASTYHDTSKPSVEKQKSEEEQMERDPSPLAMQSYPPVEIKSTVHPAGAVRRRQKRNGIPVKRTQTRSQKKRKTEPSMNFEETPLWSMLDIFVTPKMTLKESMEEYLEFRNSRREDWRTTGSPQLFVPKDLNRLVGVRTWFALADLSNFIFALRNAVKAKPDVFEHGKDCDILPLFTNAHAPEPSEFATYMIGNEEGFRAWSNLKAVLIPIHISQHYILLKYTMGETVIQVLDSLPTNNSNRMAALTAGIGKTIHQAMKIAEVYTHFGLKEPEQPLPFVVQPTPLQLDNASCEPFVCYYLTACMQAHRGVWIAPTSNPVPVMALRELVAETIYFYSEDRKSVV